MVNIQRTRARRKHPAYSALRKYLCVSGGGIDHIQSLLAELTQVEDERHHLQRLVIAPPIKPPGDARGIALNNYHIEQERTFATPISVLASQEAVGAYIQDDVLEDWFAPGTGMNPVSKEPLAAAKTYGWRFRPEYLVRHVFEPPLGQRKQKQDRHHAGQPKAVDEQRLSKGRRLCTVILTGSGSIGSGRRWFSVGRPMANRNFCDWPNQASTSSSQCGARTEATRADLGIHAVTQPK